MRYKFEILQISDYRWDNGRESSDTLQQALNEYGKAGWRIAGIHNGEIFLERHDDAERSVK